MRAPVDRRDERTDGRDETRRDEVSLPLYFNSLVAIFSLVHSLFVFLSSRTVLCFFHGKFDTSFLSPSLCPSIISAPLRFLCRLPLVIDNSASHLVLLSHSSIPRPYFLFFFYDFPYLSFLLSTAFLRGPTVFASLVLSLLSRSAHPARLAQYPFSSPFFFLCRPIVCGALLPSLLLRSVLPLTFQRYSRRLLLFLPSAVECRGRGRKRDGGQK